MTNNSIHLIKAIDPADLLIQANEQIAIGRDLYTSPFVSHEGCTCQRMAKSMPIYEYKLVIAKDLDDLHQQENNAIEMGYDFAFNTVLWNAKYLQWMTRYNTTPLPATDLIDSVQGDYIVARRIDELQLVEDVQSIYTWRRLPMAGTW